MKKDLFVEGLRLATRPAFALGSLPPLRDEEHRGKKMGIINNNKIIM